jgi:hypothetical protein
MREKHEIGKARNVIFFVFSYFRAFVIRNLFLLHLIRVEPGVSFAESAEAECQEKN